MTTKILQLILFFLLWGCAHSVTIDPNLEAIPRELAIDYLQNESQKFSTAAHCVYTNTGINGFPYDELLYDQGVDGHIRIYRKQGGTRSLWGASPECNAIFYTMWEIGDYSSEELQVAVNKTCSALESLGVKRGTPTGREDEFQLYPGGPEAPLNTQAVSFEMEKDGLVPAEIATEEIIAFAKSMVTTGETPCEFIESYVSTDPGGSSTPFAGTCFRAENVSPNGLGVLEVHLILLDSDGNKLCSSPICYVTDGQKYFNQRYYRLGSALLSLGSTYCPEKE